MKLKKRVLVIAVLLALVTVALLYNYITNIETPPPQEIKTVAVITAINTIPENTRITQEMLQVTNIPEDAVHPDAVKDTVEIVGFITKSEIITGEQVLKSRVAFDQEDTDLSYLIPENMRAFTILIGEASGVAGYIAPGDKVDILATYAEEIINPTPITITQFQNIEVIRKGINPQNNADAINANGGLTTSITLLVTPQQAEVLFFASQYGALNLTLRNPLDGEKVDLTQFGIENFGEWRSR